MSALAGAKFTGFAVGALKPMGLMIVATCTLASTAGAPERATISSGSRVVRNERRAAPAPRLFGGIGLVFRDRYLLMIAVFVVLLVDHPPASSSSPTS